MDWGAHQTWLWRVNDSVETEAKCVLQETSYEGEKHSQPPQNVGKDVYDIIKQMIWTQNLTHRIQTLKIHTHYISSINNSKEIYNVKRGGHLWTTRLWVPHCWFEKEFSVIYWYSMSWHRFCIHTESEGKKEIFGPASLNYQIPRTFRSLNDPVVIHEGALGGIPPKQWLLRGNNHRRGLQHFGGRLYFLLKFY